MVLPNSGEIPEYQARCKLGTLLGVTQRKIKKKRGGQGGQGEGNVLEMVQGQVQLSPWEWEPPRADQAASASTREAATRTKNLLRKMKAKSVRVDTGQ